MKLRILLLFILLLLGACSRESSIKPNPLLGEHPVVFLLREKPKDIEAFVDSVLDLPGDSVILADTLVATRNDTVWCLGYFRGQQSSVRIYSWNISDGRSFGQRTATDLLPISFADTGLYNAKYHLVDGVKGRDSAGSAQFIRIIDIPPTLSYASDTVSTSQKGPGLISLLLADSAGTVDTLRVDYDNDGEWDTVLVDFIPNDTTFVQVPKVQGAQDSLSNQKVRLGIWDDDGNAVLDTIVLHFNTPPTIVQDFPTDSSRVSIFDRFAFYWHGVDTDNPKDMRYTLRVGKVPVLTQSHAVLSLADSKSWEQVRADSTLTDTTLKGHLYWQVWVTDGYDTVYSPVRKFYLGDPNVRFATVGGVALLQASKRHDGVRLSLTNKKTGAIYLTHTNSKYYTRGDYTFADVEPGCYRLDAQDTVDLFYSPAHVDSFCVDIGEVRVLDTLHLLDQSKPRIALSQAPDSLYKTRSVHLSGVFADSGSFIALSTVKATLDGKSVALTNPTQNNWSVDLLNLVDGRHLFVLTGSDSAGNVATPLQVQVFVRATTLNFAVAGPDKQFAQAVSVLGGTGAPGSGDSLHFKVEVNDASPVITMVYFSLLGDGNSQKDVVGATAPSIGGVQTFTLDTVIDIPFDEVRSAIVTMINDSGFQYSDTVSYRVRDRGKASVLFLAPATDMTITLNDVLSLLIDAHASEGNSLVEYAWDLDHNTTAGTGLGFDDSAATFTPTQFTGSAFGTWSLKVRIKDNASPVPMIAYDTVKVTVLSQPPHVTVANEKDTVKINGDIQLNAYASDVAPGTIEKTEWKCGTGAWEEVLPGLHTVTAPASAQTLQCIVRVTDNDGETALDTTTVLVRQDAPTVKVMLESGTATIKDSLPLRAMAADSMGSIVSQEWSCGLPGVAGVTGFKVVAAADSFWTAPSVGATSWLCVVRVKDDDNQTAIDTTRWTILLDAPRVTATEDSLLVSILDPVQLDAIAFDSLGRIVKYEWSCGAPGAAGSVGWVTYASPSATITMPAQGQDNYLCVIRVTDDDDNRARDTVFLKVDQDAPTVQVEKSWISTRINEVFFVNSIASDGFGNIASYRWSCGEPGTAGTTGHWTPEFVESFTQFTAPATATVTWICIVEVKDEDGQTAQDTAHILVLQPPNTVLNADEKLAVWSGDVDLATEYRYFNQADGISSVIGQPWGDLLNREYWWNFSHYQPTAWWLGPSDGTLDISYAGFDEALIRPTSPTAVKISLDFRDSILPFGETDSAFRYDFYLRHLDYDTATIQFVRFWNSLGPDTVIQPATRSVRGVATPTGPAVAFRESVAGLGYVKRFEGSAWNTVGGSDFGGGASVDSVRLVRDPITGDLIVAYRTTTGDVVVKRSASGTGAWQQVSTTVSVNGNNPRQIAVASKNGIVALAWIGNDSLGLMQISSSTVNAGAWSWNGTAGQTGTATNGEKSLELQLVFNTGSTDTLAIGYVRSTYKPRLRLARGTNLGTFVSSTDVYSGTANALSMAWSSNGTIYFGFNNRTNPGAMVRSWKGGTYGTETQNIGIHLVGTSTSMAIAADGLPYFAYDDNFFSPYITVWKWNGSAWKLWGENLLPHFKSVFYDQHGYYLRGTSPSLSVAPDGTLYLALMAKDGRGSASPNNGPIVMRYTE